MSTPDQKWSRLVTAARAAGVAGEMTAPYGFSTRVTALAFASDAPSVTRLERWSLRALGLAALLAVVSVAGNYTALMSALQGDSNSVDDPVAEVVDMTS